MAGRFKRALVYAAVFGLGYVVNSCTNENQLEEDSRVTRTQFNEQGGLDVEVQQLTGFDQQLYIKTVKMTKTDNGIFRYESEGPWNLFITSDTRVGFVYPARETEK